MVLSRVMSRVTILITHITGLITLLGVHGVVISRVISRLTILLTHIKGRISLLITTPEPPSRRLNPSWTLKNLHF